VSTEHLARGLKGVVWPARLTPLKGRLRDMLPPGHELWLDGGHNAHGAAALATALDEMQRARPKPQVLIVGMMNTRAPEDFLEAFRGRAQAVYALTIPGEANAHRAAAIAAAARKVGFVAVPKRSIEAAVTAAAATEGARVVICGSLYLAGHVLARNGTPPD